MSDKPENPPAFPRPGFEQPAGLQDGMTLRDYFAAAAFPIMLHRDFYSKSNKYEVISPSSRSHPLYAARESYRYADAMLRERGK